MEHDNLTVQNNITVAKVEDILICATEGMPQLMAKCGAYIWPMASAGLWPGSHVFEGKVASSQAKAMAREPSQAMPITRCTFVLYIKSC